MSDWREVKTLDDFAEFRKMHDSGLPATNTKFIGHEFSSKCCLEIFESDKMPSPKFFENHQFFYKVNE